MCIEDIMHKSDPVQIYYKHQRCKFGLNSIDPREFYDEDGLIKWLKDEKGVKTWKKLYAYEHGGITVRTGETNPFNCQWDSGQVGFATSTEENDEQSIDSLVKELDMLLRGQIYGVKVFRITKCDLGHEHEEEIDSLWGIWDSTYKYKWCEAEAKGIGWIPVS